MLICIHTYKGHPKYVRIRAYVKIHNCDQKIKNTAEQNHIIFIRRFICCFNAYHTSTKILICWCWQFRSFQRAHLMTDEYVCLIYLVFSLFAFSYRADAFISFGMYTGISLLNQGIEIHRCANIIYQWHKLLFHFHFM